MIDAFHIHKMKILYIVLITVLMAIGEHFFKISNSVSISTGEYLQTYILVFLVLLISFLSRLKFIGIITATLVILGTGINITYQQYFGRLLMPYDISMFFNEVIDTSKGLIGGIRLFIFPLIWYTTLYIFSIFIILKSPQISSKTGYSASFFSTLFIIVFFIPAFKGKNFEVNLHYSVVRNSIGVYTHYIGDLFKKDNLPTTNYKPYILTKKNSSMNILFIMGESANNQHMSLYGYHRNNTPFLNYLADTQSDKFKFYNGVSRGFSTRIGVPLTLNVIQEPDNIKQLLSLDTSLFNLAKKNGYRTYYLSNQKSGVLASLVNAADVDEFHDVNSKQIPKTPTHDFRLIQMLENQVKEQDHPFFIVLHQRNHHFAYDENYPEQYNIYNKATETQAKIVDTYDNSVHYQDNFIKSIIDITKKISNKPTLIIYTSDHGELLGYEGLWGHGTPIVQSAGVPIFIYAINGAEQALVNDNLPNDCLMDNYQLGKFIASNLGWSIENPNEVEDIFVNITLPYDDIHGYKKFKRVEAKQALCSLSKSSYQAAY